MGLGLVGCAAEPAGDVSTGSPAATVTVTASAGQADSFTPASGPGATGSVSGASALGASPSSAGSITAGSGSTEPTVTASPDSAAAPSPSRLPEPVPGQPLTLGDFFEPDRSWTENTFSVADMSDVKGMASDRLTCGEGYDDAALELRLQNKFEALTFSVAQSNSSKKSDQGIVVRVMADNAPLDMKRVKFNEVTSFTADVKDRNAVRLEVFQDDEVEGCSGGSVQAVIFDAEVK